MKKLNLPKIKFTIPQNDTIFTLKINDLELNVTVLIGHIDFKNISTNTSQVFLKKATVKIIKDQKYSDFSEKYLDLYKTIESNNCVLYVKAEDLFLSNKSFYSTCHLEEFSKSFMLPVLYPNTLVELNEDKNLYAIDKSTEISFNYVTGNVSYLINLKSLISDCVIKNNCSINDILTIF